MLYFLFFNCYNIVLMLRRWQIKLLWSMSFHFLDENSNFFLSIFSSSLPGSTPSSSSSAWRTRRASTPSTTTTPRCRSTGTCRRSLSSLSEHKVMNPCFYNFTQACIFWPWFSFPPSSRWLSGAFRVYLRSLSWPV